MDTVKVSVSYKYQQRFYPACEKAEMFCKLTGRGATPAKTLTREHIDIIKALGFNVETVAKEL